ncbi:site-specific integrase [Fundicoccus culcitae]|uniref:Site-specific integrase n=1 Tax=Fundicoccus culcitae TaxID=2969821 RepID=A0ABY5P253_9LACT|nr:site-specific integrase [Fundicoccus culcitae]UUX32787.1 site-specific integrase [Fundicoccus culcitae]
MLPNNPSHRTGSIGEKHAEERNYWINKEFKLAINTFDNVEYITAYSILFFTGIKESELLALTIDNFDLDNQLLTINSNWVRRQRKNATTSTKTRSSNRVVTFPKLLVPLINEYINSLYGYIPHMRLFSQLNKYYLNDRLNKAVINAGVKKITVHELRHSHASVLINNEINIKALQQRLGHKNIDTTLNIYSHMYPTKQKEIANLLDNLGPK